MDQRRVRTHWMLRERYRRAALFAAVLGGALALALLVGESGAAALSSPSFLIASLVVVIVSALVPRQLVLSVGRWQWRRAR